MSDKIPNGLSRDHLLEAINKFDEGVDHEFADSTKYDLVYEGKVQESSFEIELYFFIFQTFRMQLMYGQPTSLGNHLELR